ncbi:MAG TPA: hypothetical protein VFP21_00145, partial [Solirubrobacterales bacterium]|nr:hypothetical protein [Solirubrobacterales bacterium]
LLIEICLRRGRRSEAHRRYTRFRKRMISVFGSPPDFDLGAVERGIAAPAPADALSRASGRA